VQNPTMLIKLLENPLTVSILHLLAKKPLTILQITKNLESDTASIFAILGELHQYGLVLQIKNNKLNDSTSSSNKTDSKEIEYLGKIITEYTIYLTKEDYIKAIEEEIKETETKILKLEREIEKKKREIEDLKKQKE